ncbi:MAG: two-component sensor histidine kinase [marine bacterium B5-7]|nr:MAG: two-component sensor histidine kinase [marine bacterium B5-7]
MNPSIRKFLLINLLLSVTVVIIATALGNYYLAQRDVQRHIDSLLSQTAFAFQALINDDLTTRNVDKLQIALNSIPEEIRQFSHVNDDKRVKEYSNGLQFQVWSNQGKLLLHSPGAPTAALSNGIDGYTIKRLQGVPWRVFTTYSMPTGLSIVVAERFNSHATLGHHITDDFIMIITITYPLLGFLIWIIIGRGLGSLNRVTREIANRAPSYLKAVDVQSVPIEIKPLVQELNNLLLRLRETLDREKRFSGDAAHELRTPLAALKTHVQVAMQSDDPQASKESLKKAMRGADRCTHIIAQLLTLSRLVPEANRGHDMSHVNLECVAKEVIAELVPVALDKNIELELCAEKLKSLINGNPISLSILIRNLVDNAIRYTPEDGLVRIMLFDAANDVILRVQDNGPGIAPDLRARVFERFYRVLGNASPGSGLGLAIVQQIANLHGASVRLNEPESGTGLVIDVRFAKV